MLYEQVLIAHNSTKDYDKIIVLIVILIALGVIIWFVRAIIAPFVNHDERDSPP